MLAGNAEDTRGRLMDDEHADRKEDATRRLDAGRWLLSNPRLARQALRAGFQSLPSATVANLF